MAHLASLLLIPVDAVSKSHTRESLVSCAVQTSHCSHLIASHPDIRLILDKGIPLQSEMWHPIAKPHYHLPGELPSIVEKLRHVENSDEPFKNAAWFRGEIQRLREACESAIEHGLALVVFLSNKAADAEEMSPITHFFIGWGLANSVPSLDKRERAFVTLASVVPDLDGLGIIADRLTRNSAHPLNWWGEYHHTLCHNLGFALIVAVMAAVLAKQKLKTAILAFISFHLHLIGDMVGARGPDGDQWPIPYLLPFSKSVHLVWSGQWALNAWPNMVITAVLIGLALLWARQHGFSPLEMISTRVDAALFAQYERVFRCERPVE
jgi:inner membrane protein